MAPTEAAAIEATTELLDDLQQVVHVLFDDPASFLRARQLGQRLVFTRTRFFGRFHAAMVGREPKGTIELNQGGGNGKGPIPKRALRLEPVPRADGMGVVTT